MAGIQVNTRLDEVVVAKLDQLAKARQRSKSWLVNEAVTIFVNRETERLEAIQRGIADADAGRTLPLEQVRAEFHTWVNSHRK